jgi:hypothetical protein
VNLQVGSFRQTLECQLWESRDQGDSWTPLDLRGDRLDALVALGYAVR